jgi:hypothetical protein
VSGFETGSITKFTRYWVDSRGKRHRVDRIIKLVDWMLSSVRWHGVVRWGATEGMVHRYLIETGVVEKTGRYALIGEGGTYRDGRYMHIKSLRADLQKPLWRPRSITALVRVRRALKAELEQTPKKKVSRKVQRGATKRALGG